MTYNTNLIHSHFNDLTVEDTLFRLAQKLRYIDSTFQAAKASGVIDLEGDANGVPHLLEALDHLTTLADAIAEGQF